MSQEMGGMDMMSQPGMQMPPNMGQPMMPPNMGQPMMSATMSPGMGQSNMGQPMMPPNMGQPMMPPNMGQPMMQTTMTSAMPDRPSIPTSAINTQSHANLLPQMKGGKKRSVKNSDNFFF